MTKQAIYDYEELTCDQQKLLGQVLTCLDQRAKQLKSSLKNAQAPASTPSLDASTPSTKEDAPSATHEAATIRELTRCLDVLETIKRMMAKGRVPVVLVYRERKHRTHHRYQEKGKSNKVVFPKEKRDFLSLMGLPGSMISEKGIDFTVRPNTASAQKQMESRKNSNTPETIEISELEPDEKNGGTAVQIEGEDSESPKTTRKLLQQYLPFRKKGSVSPHPEEEEEEEETELDTKEDEEEHGEVRSTLSCDSCSSDDNSETDDELDVATDTVVPEGYVHRETLIPQRMDLDGLCVTLAMEKLGVKSTSRLVCPFLRVSVRDPEGELVWDGAVQETAVWEPLNKNYLKAPSQVHLQRPLDDLPQDMAIFLELRHHRPERGVLSTLCYTFLERQDLSNGEFICELYSPPVDYTRRALNTYTEKAFFLHLEVKLKITALTDDSLDSIQST